MRNKPNIILCQEPDACKIVKFMNVKNLIFPNTGRIVNIRINDDYKKRYTKGTRNAGIGT